MTRIQPDGVAAAVRRLPKFVQLPDANYGNSNFDVRNAVKGSLVYQLPVGKGKRFLNSNPFLDAIVGGWQTSATMFVHSGQPFTVVDVNNNAHADNPGSESSPQYPNLVGNPHLSHPTFRTGITSQPSPNQLPARSATNGTNSLVGPDLSEIDFSLGKNFSLREGIGLQFRIDGYNVFNHPSFGIPNTGVAFANGAPTSSSSHHHNHDRAAGSSN